MKNKRKRQRGKSKKKKKKIQKLRAWHIRVLPRCNAWILHALQRATFVRIITHILLLLYTYTLFTYRPLYCYHFLKGLTRLLCIYLWISNRTMQLAQQKSASLRCPLAIAPINYTWSPQQRPSPDNGRIRLGLRLIEMSSAPSINLADWLWEALEFLPSLYAHFVNWALIGPCPHMAQEAILGRRILEYEEPFCCNQRRS